MQMRSWEKVISASDLYRKKYNNIREFAKRIQDYQDESLQIIAPNWG